MAAPKIILYTSHVCPWAHRVHIALKELGLEYEEVIIDLSKPREPWYLEINPRGLVPSINYNGEIITESAIVAQFLADAHPSHLVPPSNSVEGALQRARISFFVDAFYSKVAPQLYAGFRAINSTADKDAAGEEFVRAIVKEIEPLIPDGAKGPFFGGSERLTLAEVLTGSLLLRLNSFSKPEFSLLSTKLPALLEQQAPKFKRWLDAVVKENSVNYIWNEELVAKQTKARYERLAAEGK